MICRVLMVFAVAVLMFSCKGAEFESYSSCIQEQNNTNNRFPLSLEIDTTFTSESSKWKYLEDLVEKLDFVGQSTSHLVERRVLRKDVHRLTAVNENIESVEKLCKVLEELHGLSSFYKVHGFSWAVVE